MPDLFVLPRQVPLTSTGGLLPSAQAFFYQTGTSTPQNTYSDLALTVANANPLVADTNGVFPKAYLDPSLPNYRVTLKTSVASGSVLLYTEDDVPASQNTAQTSRLKSTAPEIIFQETDASLNNGHWSLRANAEAFSLDLLSDAESVRSNVLTITRSGAANGVANFAANVLFINSLRVATTQASSFTATLTGMSAATTGTLQYEISGQHILLWASSAITGTSNSTAFTITGLPAAVQQNPVVVPCVLTNNGTSVMGSATLSGSTITFAMGSPLSATGFTSSGTKGLPAGWTLMYVGSLV